MRLPRAVARQTSCLRTLPRWKGVAALAGGVSLALAFPIHPLRPLAWVGLAPLLVALDGEDARTRFGLGWLTGVGLFVVGLHWLVGTMHDYGGLPLPLAILGQLLLTGFLACFPGAFAVGAPALGLSSPWGVLGLPALWVVTEIVRGWLFTGFPWFTLGYSQVGYPRLLQGIDLTGIHGLSALLVASSAVVARAVWAARGRARWPVAPAIGVALVVVAALAYGSSRLATAPRETPALEVALLQGNVPQDVKWDDAFKSSTVETYLRLAGEMREHAPDLVVLPETAMPFFFQRGGYHAARARELPTESGGARVLLGAPAFVEHETRPGEERSYEYRNRAYLLDSEGRVEAEYDKLHLVPFGEYSPVPFLSKFVEGVGNFRPGEERVLFEIPGFGPVATLICYEVIFPAQAREAVRAGARLLVNITNDAWFGELGAPVQHLEMAAARAVEHRMWLVRAANTGITAVIDPWGRIVARTELGETTALSHAVHAGPVMDAPYTRLGNRIGWAAALVVVVALGVDLARRRRATGSPDEIERSEDREERETDGRDG